MSSPGRCIVSRNDGNQTWSTARARSRLRLLLQPNPILYARFAVSNYITHPIRTDTEASMSLLNPFWSTTTAEETGRGGVNRVLQFLGIACALAVFNCQPRCAATPKAEPVALANAPSAMPQQTPRNSQASLVFVEKGADILEWDFQVRGLPAIDLRTGSIIIADLSHGTLASSLGLSLHWMLPDETRPYRTWWLLDEHVASTILYERDGDQKQTAALAVKAREQTRDANETLRALALRPTIQCNVQRIEEWCAHPQSLTCGDLSGQLRDSTLNWRLGTESHETTREWGTKFIEFGDSYKQALTCIDQAYFDRETSLIVVQTTSFCKERGGDACILSNGWRTVTLR